MIKKLFALLLVISFLSVPVSAADLTVDFYDPDYWNDPSGGWFQTIELTEIGSTGVYTGTSSTGYFEYVVLVEQPSGWEITAYHYTDPYSWGYPFVTYECSTQTGVYLEYYNGEYVAEVF